MVTKSAGGEKADNKTAFWVMSIGGKEGGTETVQIEVDGKLEHVRVSWVKGGFKPRCLAASSAPPPHHWFIAHQRNCPDSRTHSAHRGAHQLTGVGLPQAREGDRTIYLT